jgi:hypothetical protein
VAGEAGGGIGGVVAVVGSAAAVPGAGAAEVLRGVLARGMVARARLWLAAEDVAANPEAALRPEADARLGGILVVEGTVAEAVRAAAARGAAALGLAGETGVYGLMFADGTA